MPVSLNSHIKKHNLKSTPQRKQVLEVFHGYNRAVNLRELQEKLPETFDRVTLYRILKAFETNGLIHKVIDYGENTLYALCSPDCDTEGHLDNHIHFKCRKCARSYCLEGTSIPVISLPEGFKMIDKSFLVEGTCPDCH